MNTTLQNLQTARRVCRHCGQRHGTPSRDVATSWRGRCDVCGEVSQVRDIRDWGYLRKGIHNLRLLLVETAGPRDGPLRPGTGL
jgi:hypothetical protein